MANRLERLLDGAALLGMLLQAAAIFAFLGVWKVLSHPLHDAAAAALVIAISGFALVFASKIASRVWDDPLWSLGATLLFGSVSAGAGLMLLTNAWWPGAAVSAALAVAGWFIQDTVSPGR